MRLVVKQNGQTVNEFRFDKGPIHIGRSEKSQIRLNDGAVSRQHAAIFNTQDGKWMVEDLDSANKTYLNDQAIHKVEIKTGDRIRITDYTIEINLEESTETEKPAHLEDTLTAATSSSSQIIERKLDTADAPPIRLPAHRMMDLLRAHEKISQAGNPDELLLNLLDITSKQLGTYHNWCALRSEPTGPMTYHAGITREGQKLDLSSIKLNEKINEAIEKSHFLLFIFSKDMSKDEKGQIRSIVISPIIGPAGCYGVLYANNTFRDDHYSLSDLDYLMLLGMHIAAVVQKMETGN
jgi:pSer/pThr/pTyr-binding forkhead associated (FHA) protein